MDLMNQFNGFERKRLIKPIGANSIAFYIALLGYCNQLRFPERFTAPNSTLQGRSSLSPKALQRARNELMQEGYIHYKKGSGNQCGIYELVDLCGFSSDNFGQNENEKEFDSSFCPTNVLQLSHKVSHKCPTNVSQMSHKVSTLNIQDYTETKQDVYDNNHEIARAEVFRFYRDNMGTNITPMIALAIDDWLRSVDESLILYAISEAVANNVRNWKYIHRIIQSHFAAGRKTWAEAEEASQSRRERFDDCESWADDIDDILLGKAGGADD